MKTDNIDNTVDKTKIKKENNNEGQVKQEEQEEQEEEKEKKEKNTKKKKEENEEEQGEEEDEEQKEQVEEKEKSTDEKQEEADNEEKLIDKFTSLDHGSNISLTDFTTLIKDNKNREKIFNRLKEKDVIIFVDNINNTVGVIDSNNPTKVDSLSFVKNINGEKLQINYAENKSDIFFTNIDNYIDRRCIENYNVFLFPLLNNATNLETQAKKIAEIVKKMDDDDDKLKIDCTCNNNQAEVGVKCLSKILDLTKHKIENLNINNIDEFRGPAGKTSSNITETLAGIKDPSLVENININYRITILKISAISIYYLFIFC